MQEHRRREDIQCQSGANVPGQGLIPANSIITLKSQRQPLPKIILDLNMPRGMVEVASFYVPLSRMKQLADIAILRDFDISSFQIKPSND